MCCFYCERDRRKRRLCFLSPKAVHVGDGEMLSNARCSGTLGAVWVSLASDAVIHWD